MWAPGVSSCSLADVVTRLQLCRVADALLAGVESDPDDAGLGDRLLQTFEVLMEDDPTWGFGGGSR